MKLALCVHSILLWSLFTIGSEHSKVPAGGVALLKAFVVAQPQNPVSGPAQLWLANLLLTNGNAQAALSAERERSQLTARQLETVTSLALRAGAFGDIVALYVFAVRELVQLLNADHGGVLVLDPD